MSIADKLVTVAENQHKIYEAGQKAVLGADKIIIKRASGLGMVSMDDVSEFPHKVRVSLKNKNLFNPKPENFNAQNIEFTGSGFIVSGSFITYNFKDFVVGETYFISGVGGTTAVEAVDAVGNILYGWYNIEIKQGVAFTVPNGTGFMRIYFYGTDGGAYSNIQIEKGTTATPYTPYLDDINIVEVKRYGKNLISSIGVFGTENVTIENGVVTQIEADTKEFIIFKIQYHSVEGTWHQEEIVPSASDIGVLSIPFNIEHEIDLLRFGVSGSKIDTVVGFNTIPRGTYVFSCNVTNLTQGSVSWRDMQIEVGTSATPYEPCTKAVAQGDTVFFDSVSPNMTIICNKRAQIEVEYHESYGMHVLKERLGL